MAKKYSGIHKVRMVINSLKGRDLTIAQISSITNLHYETVRKIASDLVSRDVLERTHHNGKHITYRLLEEHRKRTIPTNSTGQFSLLKIWSSNTPNNAPMGTLGYLIRTVLTPVFMAAKKQAHGHNVEADVRMARKEIDLYIKKLTEEIQLLEYLRDDDLIWSTTAMETWPSDPDWAKYESEIPYE